MKELDPILHSQLRLAVMSILMSVDEADFVYLKEKTESRLPSKAAKPLRNMSRP